MTYGCNFELKVEGSRVVRDQGGVSESAVEGEVRQDAGVAARGVGADAPVSCGLLGEQVAG